jgi:hypothetical protein
MHHPGSRILFGISAIGLYVSAASAAHNEPFRARFVRAWLVTSYMPCTTPNDTLPGTLAFPACTPEVRSDSVCGFSPTGSGQLSIQRDPLGSNSPVDIRVIATLQNLNAGCIGETLCADMTLRVTTHNCLSGGTCTSVDMPYLTPACCVVAGNGSCSFNTTFNTFLPGSIPTGNVAGYEIRDAGLTRTTGPLLPAKPFIMGAFIP